MFYATSEKFHLNGDVDVEIWKVEEGEVNLTHSYRMLIQLPFTGVYPLGFHGVHYHSHFAWIGSKSGRVISSSSRTSKVGSYRALRRYHYGFS